VDFDIQPVPDNLLKFPELESLSLNHPPPNSSALMILLQAYGKRLKKLIIDSSIVSIDVVEIMNWCPLLEKLHVHCIALDQSSQNPNLGVMNSLVSVNIYAWR
jgi:hypothetical protein